MSISAISGPGGVTPQTNELPNLMNSMIEGLRTQENEIRNSLFDGLKPNGDLMGLPDHVKAQFKEWDSAFTGTEDRKLVDQLKRKIIELTKSNEAYISEQVQNKTARFQLELAMRAANKTTSGIQQLLSSQ